MGLLSITMLVTYQEIVLPHGYSYIKTNVSLASEKNQKLPTIGLDMLSWTALYRHHLGIVISVQFFSAKLWHKCINVMIWFHVPCLYFITTWFYLHFKCRLIIFLNKHGYMPLIFRDKRHVLCTNWFVTACLIRLLSLHHALSTRHAIYQLAILSDSDEIYVHHYLILYTC